MSLHRIPVAARLIAVGGLLVAGAAAQAAGGTTVTKPQEMAVTAGMDMSQVRSALGRPEREFHFANEPGPTFTYRIAGTDESLFDVDFGADGKVASVAERVEESGGP